MSFVVSWNQQEAANWRTMAALVRRFAIGCVTKALEINGQGMGVLQQVVQNGLDVYLEDNALAVHRSGPLISVTDDLTVQIKPFSQCFARCERIVIYAPQRDWFIVLRIGLEPDVENTGVCRITDVCVGLSTVAPEIPTDEMVQIVGEAWAGVGETPQVLPPDKTGERVLIGRAWAPQEWTDEESELVDRIGAMLAALLPSILARSANETMGDVAAQLTSYFEARGFRYSPEVLATFYGALKAKGFVILLGISGTGKTKLAQEFAQVLGLSDDVHFLLESVKPDWRDNTGLLGYWNPVTRQYEGTRFLRLILTAGTELQKVRQFGAPETGLIGFIEDALNRSETNQQIARCRETLQRINANWGSWSDEDLDLLWRTPDNGIAILDERVPVLPDSVTNDILRDVTAALANESNPLEERIQEGLNRLTKAGAAVPQRMRLIRVLATLEPEQVCAIVDRMELARACAAVGNPHKITGSDESTRWQAVLQAWQDLRTKTRELVSALNRNSDDTALLLTVDRLTRDFSLKAPLSYASSASGNPTEKANPYFVLLDEMNLARVEYYLADVLSVMESGRVESGPNRNFSRGKIRLHAGQTSIQLPDGMQVPPEVALPPNLYFIGTVNMDETTFAFSPKVLDRAFTIAFNDVNLDDYPPSTVETEVPHGVQAALVSDFTRHGAFAGVTKADVAKWGRRFGFYVSLLDDLNKKLSEHQLNFGYRVVDEILAFMAAIIDSPLSSAMSEEAAFDAGVTMKVLPKFRGPRARLVAPLEAVIQWAGPRENPRFPITCAKAEAMLKGAATGYVSYM